MRTPRMPRVAQLFSLLFPLLLTGVHGAEAAFQPDLMVKVASEADSAYVGRGVFEDLAQTQSKGQATFGGTTVVFRFLLQNAGDAADSFVLRGAASGSGFTVQYLDEAGTDRTAAVTATGGFPTGSLAPGNSLSLLVRVTPTVLTVGTSYRVSITASSDADGGKTDQVKSETVICGSSAAVLISVPPDRAGVPGSVVNYPYSVTNVGSSANSFALVASNSAGWDGELYADNGAAGGVAGDGIRQSGENSEAVSTGPLQPGQSYRFFLAVTVPKASSDGTHSETRLAVTGQGASTADRVTTTATAAIITVVEDVRNLTLGGIFATTTNAFPGDTLEYRMSITNSGQAPATVVSIDTPLPQNMSFVPGTLWVSTSAEGDGTPCPAARCGWVREAGGTIVGRLGQGATATAGGELAAGRSLYVFFRVQVD